MKVCVKAHTSSMFGDIPEGSLWADDSPYVLDDYADHFAPVDDEPAPPPVRKPPVRKFGEKKAVD